jgi:gas vesicle protein
MDKKDFFRGALLGALLGSAAALLTTSKTGKQRREEIKKLSSDLSGKIVKEVQKMKELSQEQYEAVVERVVREYGKKKKVAKATLEEVIDELKDKWVEIKKGLR